MEGVQHLVPSVCCLICGVHCVELILWVLVCNVQLVVSSVWRPACGVQRVVPSVWRPVCGVHCVLFIVLWSIVAWKHRASHAEWVRQWGPPMVVPVGHLDGTTLLPSRYQCCAI